MDNAIWVIFGILAFLLALGILISLIGSGAEEQKMSANSNAVKEFGQWCQYVCNSDVETKLAKEIEISSGAVISTASNNICLEFDGKTNCADCTCDLNAYTLNLNTPEHLELYTTHVFRCSFQRTPGGVWLDCKG